MAVTACLLGGLLSYIKQLFYFAIYRISKTANLQFEEILKSLGNSLQAAENLPKPLKIPTTHVSCFLKAGNFPVFLNDLKL